MEILTLKGLEAIYSFMIFKESLLIYILSKYLSAHLLNVMCKNNAKVDKCQVHQPLFVLAVPAHRAERPP